MANIFGTNIGQPMVVRASKAVITVDKDNYIAIGINISFQRGVEIQPTLGDTRIVSLGEPSGTCTINSILAKGVNIVHRFHLDGSDCKPFDISLSFQDGACDMNGKTVKLKNCFASAVSVEAQAGRGTIAQGVTVTFTGMEMA